MPRDLWRTVTRSVATPSQRAQSTACVCIHRKRRSTMKVFVAGATGAVGKRLVPQLIASGYEVVAMTRSPHHVDALRAAGAEPLVADALDRTAVMLAIQRAEPEIIIHQLSAL